MGPQEDYIETVFTCEGDFDDPHLQDRLDDFQSSLKDLLLTDKNKLILKKVEPWNSVRVTFNIPREAAARLKQLAQQGNATLRDLGVLAVTILDQHISLTIAGRNNERTHLVFKTADTISGSSVSVFDSQSPALDVLRPPGPGPSNVEATRKNIQDYLKGSLIDSLFGRGEAEKARHPGELNSRPNNIFPGHLGDPFHSRNPATTSPSTSGHSPSRSPGVAAGPAMPPGLPPGLPFGPGNSIAGLPPPPPYPQGSSYMNNLQKLRFGSTSTSPLLVNLLQNDPGLSSLLASGKIPPIDPDALQPPKKKRKPRKPREKKPKPGSEGEFSVKNVPNPVLSSSTSSQYSSASAMYTQSVRDHNSLQHSQAMHNTSVQNVCDDRVPLTSEQSSVKKLEAEPESSAGKIINPVTGLLEPIENLSDTSPEKVSPKSIGSRPPSGKAGDIISNLITTHIKSDNQDTNFGNQRTYSMELSASHKAAVGRVSQWSEKSSQLSGSASSDSIEQKREAIRQEFINMIHKEKSKDVRKTEKSGQHNLPLKVRDHPAVLDGKQAVPSLGHATAPREEKASLPQEREVKSIPSQLLNKPLLEVKHNSVTNPTGSPDSNGDSECSSQGIGIEPHLGQEPSTVNAVTPIDQHLKSYNNDSGVGSSSERSEDPSEPGDNDYKGTQSNNNSFECAKSQLLDTSKQPPTSSNAMTVAHATMTDIQKDLKNHKILSPYLSPDALVNSKIEPLNPKLEHLMNDRTFHKGVKDHIHMLNSVEPNKTQLVSESMNRKSPKLVAGSPKLAGQEGQLKSQGNPENPPTQKKKYSPRNSPRGSPRPRASNSPRNSGSPRASEYAPGSVGSRMPFFTAQDFSAHLPVRSESHLGLQRNEQVRSPYNEQRKSPFALSQIPPYSNPSLLRTHHPGMPGGEIENRRELSHSGNVDVARLSAQCNIDNVAMLKSLEAYHNPHTQLHLSALAGTKDPIALQRKLEEFRPIFQQLQQQAAQAHLIVPPATNGTDQQHSPSRSPVAGHPNGPVTASSDVHNVLDIVAQRGNSHPGVGSVSMATVPTESSGNCVGNRLNKTVDEQKGTNATSGVRRSSPGVANTVPFPYASSLPLPKRLTESVQKLVKPLPLDNSLPHQTSRSPSSSASTIKQGHSSQNSSGKASVRTSSSSGHKTPVVNDVSHFDIDSITPSITGFCFEGPLDLGHSLPQISSPTLHEEIGPPSLQLTDSSFSAGALLGSIPHASTKLVPAVTSTILSHKTYSSETPLASNSAFVSCRTVPGGGLIPNHGTVSTAITSANVSTTFSVCNSEVKMANLSAKEQTKPGLNSSGLGPPILQPYNARHPLLKHEEKPKSPYQQMDLSEMLQETANLQSVTAERLPAHNSVSQRTASNSQLNVDSALNQEQDCAPVGEHSELPIPPVLSRQNSSTSDSKHLNCDSSITMNRETNETLSISGASNNLIVNSSASSSLHLPPLESNKSQVTTNPVNSKSDEISESGPVLENKQVTMSCRTETLTTVKVSDNKVVEPVETSQSESDAPPSGHIHKDCDKMKKVETVCDKVNVEPVSGTEVRTSLSLPSPAAANSSASSLSLDSDMNEKTRSEVLETTENLESSKSTKVRDRSQNSIEESHEETADSGEVDSAPRQLRSRKRTNTGESDGSIEESSKKAKLESSSSAVLNSNESKQLDDSNTQSMIDTVKSGLRARTNVKPEEKDKEKDKVKLVPGKDGKKEVKMATKTVPEKKPEPAKPEEIRRNSQSRRSRQSPSTILEKTQNASGIRDKSPVRSRTRGRNSPVVVEQHEETLENKRTTRSAKTKVEPQAPEPAPVNKRRRTSRDHR